MAHTFLVFDFGTNEDAAQQARHKIENWKQAFRLGNKVLLKFEREETAGTATDTGSESEEKSKGKSSAKAEAKPAKTAKETAAQPNGRVRLLIRLDFSDHEKLSRHRWTERIPGEEPFKSATGKTIEQDGPEFAKISDLFDSLD